MVRRISNMKDKIKKGIIKTYDSKYFKMFLISLGIIIPVLVEKYIYTNVSFNFERAFIILLVVEFVALNFILDIKKMWEWIYKYRYLIGICMFAIIVAFGYHGSSIGLYNKFIEPSTDITSGTPILGGDRAIRSDEWMVGTPATLSQASPINDYSEINKTMMGIEGNVSFYPKLPTKTWAAITSPRLLGFLFLPLTQAFSFNWYFELFAIFFASFEFFMIITKKKKVWSLAGAMLISFAPAVQWWSNTTLIWVGLAAIVLFNKFLNSKSIKKKILLSVLIGWLGAVYIQVLYPAWLVTYAYIYLAIIIWQLIENKGKYKLRDIFLLLFIVIAVIAALIIPLYMSSKSIFTATMNTVYPGARFSTGGMGWEHLFNYIVSTFLPYIRFGNASEASQFLCFYPIPLIIGIKCIIDNYKTHKKDWFLILLTLSIILLSIWNFVEIPKFISKITLLSFSTSDRSQVTVGFGCVVLMIYCLANYASKENKNKYLTFALAFVLTFLGVYVTKNAYPELSKKVLLVSMFIFTIADYLILLNIKKYSKFIAVTFIVGSFAVGGTVHPISRGLGVIFEKPVSKEIQSIVNSDSDGLWLATDTAIYVQNYTLANGAKVLNSVNFYPNYDLWDIIDPENQYEDVWNRYAHFNVNLTKASNSVELLQADSIKLNLNVNSICDIGVDYLISSSSTLDDYSNKTITITNIYGNENMFIYHTECHS